MKTEKIIITKMSLTECLEKKEKAEEEIARLTQNEDRLTDFGQYRLGRAKWDRLILDDYIRTMKGHARDYIYLKDRGVVLKYEIGDQLFE